MTDSERSTHDNQAGLKVFTLLAYALIVSGVCLLPATALLATTTEPVTPTLSATTTTEEVIETPLIDSSIEPAAQLQTVVLSTETDCGTIDIPAGLLGADWPAESETIDDCQNPFAVTDAGYPYQVEVMGQVVKDGDEIVIPAEGTDTFRIKIGNIGNQVNHQMYRHEEGAYVLQFDTALFRQSPTPAPPDIPLLQPGTYTVVSEDEPLILSSDSTWYESIAQFFLPIAYAQQSSYVIRHAITFTLVAADSVDEEPAGASSVLFLPGIQASRLYTGADGDENRLWEPNRNDDVKLLAMTEEGKSLNSVYTKDVLDEVFGAKNVYKQLLDLLAELKTEGAIVDYEPFAYDWRYDVFTVATEPVLYENGEEKLLVEEVKRLAADSHTGKVTIVAHSNGGLVAKALMNEYQSNELDGLIEKVIFVGTPQIGTPKAIGSLLHGLDQGFAFEFLVRQATARSTSQYMPGAYGLLPSETYFDTVTEPIITSDSSAVAHPVASYGDLNDYEQFMAFLSDQLSTRNEVTNVTQPITLSAEIFDRTVRNQERLDSWVAPEEVQVIEVAGTGLKTVDGFAYREFSCRENPMCVLEPFLKPVPRFTLAGDETVVLSSATAYGEDKITYEVNLEAEGRKFLETTKNHGNMTESASVLEFLQSAFLYPQLVDSYVTTEFSSVRETYTIIGVHSPVSIVVQNSSGEIVGRVGGEVVEEIPGGSYFEFAGSKYVIVPNSADIEVLLKGEAAGRYSLTIETIDSDDTQRLQSELLGATSTAQMNTQFVCADGECSTLEIDYEGDGVVDSRLGWSGEYEVIAGDDDAKSAAEEPSVTRAVTGTQVRPPSGQLGRVAGVSTDVSQADLLRMWEEVMKIKETLDRLEIEIINKK